MTEENGTSPRPLPTTSEISKEEMDHIRRITEQAESDGLMLSFTPISSFTNIQEGKVSSTSLGMNNTTKDQFNKLKETSEMEIVTHLEGDLTEEELEHIRRINEMAMKEEMKDMKNEDEIRRIKDVDEDKMKKEEFSTWKKEKDELNEEEIHHIKRMEEIERTMDEDMKMIMIKEGIMNDEKKEDIRRMENIMRIEEKEGMMSKDWEIEKEAINEDDKEGIGRQR